METPKFAGVSACSWPVVATCHVLAIAVLPGSFPTFIYAQGTAPKIDKVGAALDSELNQLRRERDSLASVRNSTFGETANESDEVAAQRQKLKEQLKGLLTELARRPTSEQSPIPSKNRRTTGSITRNGDGKTSPTKTSKPYGNRMKSTEGAQPEATTAPVDPMALSEALFRMGDYNGALKAFELAKKTTTDQRDRIAIKYFTAACLDKLGNAQESMMLFREVANSKADDVLADCAKWQLSTQQWKEAARAKIVRLRTMRIAETPDAGDRNSLVDARSEDENIGAQQ